MCEVVKDRCMEKVYSKIYFISGTKNYLPFQGDTCEEVVHVIVPADDEDSAISDVMKNEMIDNILNVQQLYEVLPGVCGDACGAGVKGDIICFS